MKRNNLIALAVGTIMGAALSAAYADQQLAPAPDNQQANQAPAAAGHDVTNDRSDVRRDRADIRADAQDIQPDRADLRNDERALRQEYTEQRAGTNEQGDITREQADISKDRQDLQHDRADLHADQRDLRSDSSTERMARRGGQRADSERIGAGATAHGGTLVASTRGAGTVQATNAAQRPHMAQASTHPQGLTPAGMANNAAEETKKPPATKVVHQAWWHWFW